MIGIIFNHDMSDDPYKQSSVDAGFKKLDQFIERLNETVYITFGERRPEGLISLNMEDEYVIIQHSNSLTQEQKQELVCIIKEILQVKKTIYKKQTPEGIIVFEKVAEENYFTF